MSNTIDKKEIRDTDTKEFVAGQEESSGVDHTVKPGTTLLIINDLNSDISYEAVGSFDEDSDFSQGAQLLSGESAAAGEVVYETCSYTWDKIQFQVTANSIPTSGTVTIKEMG